MRDACCHSDLRRIQYYQWKELYCIEAFGIMVVSKYQCLAALFLREICCIPDPNVNSCLLSIS